MHAVELSGITKTFGETAANSNVSMTIRQGSIHAIVGENGAGKSTLTKIIYGMHQPSSGTMRVNGHQVRFNTPQQAIQAGIGMVHQHFMLIDGLTVTENIILGQEHRKLFMPLKRSQAASAITAIATKHGMQIDPEALIEDLSVGEEQRVEILKLLYRKAEILLLDEPTAVLTPEETRHLFTALRSLQKEGKTIILITHKLDEVLEISDMVSVMKSGRIVGTVPTSSVTKEDLARMMVGRNVLLRVDNPVEHPGRTILDVATLSCRDPKGRPKLNNLSFQVRAGEIYGIAGVEGNGQTELLELLWAMSDCSVTPQSIITIDGKTAFGMSPRQIAESGVSHIPEDRLKHAVIPQYLISENLIFGRQREKKFHKGAGFNSKAIASYTAQIIDAFDIRGTRDSNVTVAELSGGNQQKIVLARELDRPGLKLLLLAQPTRGVDIGAIELIHKQIIAARDRGIAILLISAELEEIISLSTRIGCLYKGTIRHEFSAEEVRNARGCQQEFEKKIGLHIT
ncbi:MAG: ABC transporter ATP-binding protein [Prosthecochloris sp.]|uniref:ABC transporter related n=2 Tax=Prosthecochloris TaxID=1101 RepID=B4S824_PROA2|nr:MULTISPECIES: ABC transporter ATP-binding protein [Prosthecochloris]ACF46211.1 ABC transporter related [Prosthecochloris aestuarii DSM 271]MCW8799111.1 ABC transporter ATP-binding protein [Prosthecochloris sp.]